jgi:hypothetical protein
MCACLFRRSSDRITVRRCYYNNPQHTGVSYLLEYANELSLFVEINSKISILET